MATTTITSDVDLLQGKKILQYPLGLGSNAKDPYGELNQYMLFKINTDEKANKLMGDELLGQVYIPLTNRDGTGIATGKTDAKNADPDYAMKYGPDAAGKVEWVAQKGMQRLNKVIVLPMPVEHTVNTTITYGEHDPSTLTKAGDIFNQIGNGAASEYGTLLKNWAFAGAINKLKSGLTSTTDMMLEERKVVNPRKEMMYNDFSRRQYSFKYTFAPKNLAESEMVNEIIKTFRYYSLPEISTGKVYYIMPSEFEISFILGSRDNPNIPRIATSVLQRVSINYSPRAVWATLPNGSPLAMDMTLDFLEMELIDRRRIYNKDSVITSGY